LAGDDEELISSTYWIGRTSVDEGDTQHKTKNLRKRRTKTKSNIEPTRKYLKPSSYKTCLTVL